MMGFGVPEILGCRSWEKGLRYQFQGLGLGMKGHVSGGGVREPPSFWSYKALHKLQP